MEESLWMSEAIGHPIPNSPHAVSVALPRWEDVIGYEEKKPEDMTRLASGYQRFFIHSSIQELAGRISTGGPCLPFPSRLAAELCAEYIRHSCGDGAEAVSVGGMHGVRAGADGHAALRAFWQHTGLIVSTRQAEALMAGRTTGGEEEEIRRSLRARLAGFYDCSEDDIFLAPTGMAALFAALRALTTRTPGHPTAQLGFPYVDTLKLQQKLGQGAVFLHHLEDVGKRLETLLRRRPLAGCFCEIPGNPLLGSADLRQVSPVLKEYGVPLVVDDVVATPVNIDLSGHADLIATSLTKFIAGTGDVMGGALICNPRSPYYGVLRRIASVQHEELLWGEDLRVLEAQAKGFAERMKRHNQNGLYIAERLRRHPAVERVWYPKWEFTEAYEALRRKDGGWGALVTFLPRHAEVNSPAIYDRLRLCKGPSLGTVFTLACPFTLLAHYTELDWAEACGVSRHLIRLSVGLEDAEEVWKRLEEALRTSDRSDRSD